MVNSNFHFELNRWGMQGQESWKEEEEKVLLWFELKQENERGRETIEDYGRFEEMVG